MICIAMLVPRTVLIRFPKITSCHIRSILPRAQDWRLQHGAEQVNYLASSNLLHMHIGFGFASRTIIVVQ